MWDNLQLVIDTNRRIAALVRSAVRLPALSKLKPATVNRERNGCHIGL